MAKRPPEVREMYTVFDEMFTAAAKRFKSERPNPLKCRVMLQNLIMVMRGYDESIAELLAQQQSIARHDALPGAYALRITRNDTIQ